jgi:hypothetical protein
VAVGTDAVFYGHAAGFVPAERRINDSLVRCNLAMNDGQVFLPHTPTFPNLPQLARNHGILGQQHQPGGLAV